MPLSSVRSLLYRAACLGVVLSIASTSVAFAADPEKPVRGGQAVFLRAVDFGGMDPLTSDFFPGVVYNRLLAYKADETGALTLQPELAESWQTTADGLGLIFKLRRGVTFHDGSIFDAKVAAWNINRYVQAPKSVVRARYLPFVDQKNPTSIKDDYTLQVNLKTASVSAILSFGENALPMVSKKAVETYGEDRLASHPIGTGAFQFVKWVPGALVEVEKNRHYWELGIDGKALPYLDKITYRYMRDQSTALAEMLSGRADFSDFAVDEKDLPTVKRNAHLVLQQTQFSPNDLGTQLFFNATKAPFKDNLNLRLAFQYAIDREAGAKVMYGSQGRAHYWFFLPDTPGYATSVPHYRFNLEKAKAHLEKSGVSLPFETTMTLINRENDIKAAQILQSMLGKIGIKLKVEVLERAAWQEKVRTPNPNFEMAARFSSVNLDAPGVISSVWAEGGQTAYMRAHVDGLMEAVDAANKAPTLEEQSKILQSAQTLMHESAWMVFLWKRNGYIAMNTRLKGLPKSLWMNDEISVGRNLWKLPK